MPLRLIVWLTVAALFFAAEAWVCWQSSQEDENPVGGMIFVAVAIVACLVLVPMGLCLLFF